MDTSYRLIWLEYKNQKQKKQPKRFQALLNENLERRCATAMFPETMSQGERLERRLFWQISVVPLVLVSYFGAKYVSIINLKQHYSFKFLILDLIWFFKARLVRNSSRSYVLPLLVILSIHPIFCFPPIYMVSTSCTVIYIILNLQVINYIQWWVFIITWGSIQ